MKVFINPGHAPGGRPDPGAVNEELGLRECDIALEIGERAKSYLELAGCQVLIMQSNNLAGEEGAGENVCGCANEEDCDVFVSIHCNAANGMARGAETWCYSPDSPGGVLARCIQQQMVSSLKVADRSFPDRGVKQDPGLIVLHNTNMPAVLVETGFIDNNEDAYLLTLYADVFAAAIARGVTDYWQKLSNGKLTD